MTGVIQEVKFFFKIVLVYDFSFESCDVAHVFRCFVKMLRSEYLFCLCTKASLTSLSAVHILEQTRSV